MTAGRYAPRRPEAQVIGFRHRTASLGRRSDLATTGSSRIPIEGHTNVIRFKARATAPQPASTGLARRPTTNADDRRRYETSATQADHYRHRMLVNFAGMVVIIVLIASGSWLFGAIAQTTGEPHLLAARSGQL
jgi:hypothetical protein